MHELSVTRNIVAAVREHAGERLVEAVHLRIGKFAGVDVQAIRFCFDVCAQGTVLEGARLEIDEVDGRASCQRCGEVVALEHWVAICPCKDRAPLKLEAGDELLIHAMEVR